jgi:hypothetical protein
MSMCCDLVSFNHVLTSRKIPYSKQSNESNVRFCESSHERGKRNNYFDDLDSTHHYHQTSATAATSIALLSSTTIKCIYPSTSRHLFHPVISVVTSKRDYLLDLLRPPPNAFRSLRFYMHHGIQYSVVNVGQSLFWQSLCGNLWSRYMASRTIDGKDPAHGQSTSAA